MLPERGCLLDTACEILRANPCHMCALKNLKTIAEMGQTIKELVGWIKIDSTRDKKEALLIGLITFQGY